MYNATNISTFYVSQEHGNDRHMGIYPRPNDIDSGPVKSIEQALNRVKEMRGFGLMQPITIRVTDKVYYVEKPIVVDETMGAVTIEPETETKLIGAVKLDNFADDELNGVKCKSCAVDRDGGFTDFYVNEKRAKLPHFPKNGTLSAKEVEFEEPDHSLFGTSKWFIAHDEDFEKIKKFKNLTNCIISFNHYWVDEHTPIESIDESANKITMKYLPRFSVSNNSDRSKICYIVENVCEMFGEPNDWYYDEEAKKLYYVPEDDNFTHGYLPVTDKIFVVEGTAEKNVGGVVIRNFDIAYTRGEFVSRDHLDDYTHPNKYDGFASAQQAVSDGHATVEFIYAYGCMLENCTILCAGVNSVRICEGCRSIKICGNKITQGGAGGIVVNGGDFYSEQPQHTYANYIKDNTIVHCGRRYLCGCGILLMHSYDNIVSHNEIADIYYTGISSGWVWGYVESISKNNLIEKNHIHDLGQGMLSDMGGIYILGKQPGTMVRGNLIHDIKCRTYGGWGLYSDEGTSGVVYENNICYNVSSNGYMQHFGGSNTVRNNIFYCEKEPVCVSRPELHLGVILDRNIMVTHSNPIFKHGYMPYEAISPHTFFASNNVIFDTENAVPVGIKLGENEKPFTLDEMRENFGNVFGTVIADPMFEDAENHNFALKKDSPAYALGFEDIDMSDVGPMK